MRCAQQTSRRDLGGLYFYFHFADYIYRIFTRQSSPNAFGGDLRNHAKIPLTVRGAELLKQELRNAPQKASSVPEIIEAIAEARSHGDLSENAEYEAAKREKQGFIEGRISELEHKLSMAHIINPAEIHAEGKIVFGTTVTLEIWETEEHVTYQIVGKTKQTSKKAKSTSAPPIARAP